MSLPYLQLPGGDVADASAPSCDILLALPDTTAVHIISDRMPEIAYQQDLPPKGGYAPINFKRIPARQVILCMW